MSTVIPAKWTPLSHIRICDFTGQLAGAGATRWLAAFGAQVIRIEDPVNQGRWDIFARYGTVQGRSPWRRVRRRVPEPQRRETRYHPEPAHRPGQGVAAPTGGDQRRRDGEFRRRRARALGLRLRRAPGDQGRHHLRLELRFRPHRPLSQLSHVGPDRASRLRTDVSSGLPGLPPAGWGFSYMDHHGGNIMAVAILSALVHRQRTGEPRRRPTPRPTPRSRRLTRAARSSPWRPVPRSSPRLRSAGPRP